MFAVRQRPCRRRRGLLIQGGHLADGLAHREGGERGARIFLNINTELTREHDELVRIDPVEANQLIPGFEIPARAPGEEVVDSLGIDAL